MDSTFHVTEMLTLTTEPSGNTVNYKLSILKRNTAFTDCVCLQIDADVPSCNMSLVDDLLATGSLAVKLQAQDGGAGVRSLSIYKQTGTWAIFR